MIPLLLLAVAGSVSPLGDIHHLRRLYPQWTPEPVEVKGLGKPLVLTDVLRVGDLDTARDLAQVQHPSISAHVDSYSGYFTVDEKHNSNLFFWFFPSEKRGVGRKVPLILWLQGGPGASSLFGLFTEIGPFSVKNNNTLYPNPNSWHKNHSLLFIDNPVGTGYSYTDSDDGYATTQEQVGQHLYTALIQFFQMFPEFQGAPFFIAGESYAGKHIPSIALEIHRRNPSGELWINLQGLAIGNGFTDPNTMTKYSEYLYQMGLVDTNVYNRMQLIEQYLSLHLAEHKYLEAYFDMMSELGLIMKSSNFSNVFSVLDERGVSLDAGFAHFVQRPDIRVSLHVGETEFTSIGKVYFKLLPDFMRSAKAWVEELIDNYRVMYYSGQFDIIVAYPLSVRMFNTLRFNGSEKYRLAEREPWTVDGRLAGYIKRGGNFAEVLVRNAGHMVPTDQPVWALDLINKFTSNTL